MLHVLAAVFLAAAAFSLVKPAVAFKARYELAAAGLEVSMLTTGFMAARALSSPAAGYLGDRRPGARPLMIKASLALFPLVTLGYIYAPSPWVLVALRGLHGFLGGVAWPGMQTLVASARERRGSLMGYYFAAGNLGSTTGYLAYGHLPVTRTQLFYIAAALQAIAASLIVAERLPSDPPRPRRGRVDYGGTAAWLLAASLAGGFASGLMGEVSYVYLREVEGIGKSMLGDVLTAGSLLGVASILAAGRLSDRVGEERAAVIFILALCLGLVLFPLDSPLASAAGLVVVMASARGLLPPLRGLAAVIVPGYSGTLVGLSNTMSNLGSSVSPIIAGYMYDRVTGFAELGPLRVSIRGLYVVPALVLAVAVLVWKRVGAGGKD